MFKEEKYYGLFNLYNINKEVFEYELVCMFLNCFINWIRLVEKINVIKIKQFVI